jgi:hypothetical protein
VRYRLVLVSLVVLGVPTSAAAQEIRPDPKPIGRFVADVRAAFPKFKQDPAIASGIDVAVANLPGRTIGFVAGAHWYPARIGVMTLGLGGELMMAHASNTLAAATKDAQPGPTAKARFSALSPQVSFNFGARDGWSYISGGIGRSRLTIEREDHPVPDGDSGTKTINYGGGARWFAKPHLAVSLDVRFFAINPQLATATRPGYPRMTMMVLTGGIGFR